MIRAMIVGLLIITAFYAGYLYYERSLSKDQSECDQVMIQLGDNMVRQMVAFYGTQDISEKQMEVFYYYKKYRCLFPSIK